MSYLNYISYENYISYVNYMSYINYRTYVFNPIQDGLFRGCSRMGGGFLAPTPENPPHKSYNNEIWDSYTLPKEEPKNV